MLQSPPHFPLLALSAVPRHAALRGCRKFPVDGARCMLMPRARRRYGPGLDIELRLTYASVRVCPRRLLFLLSSSRPDTRLIDSFNLLLASSACNLSSSLETPLEDLHCRMGTYVPYNLLADGSDPTRKSEKYTVPRSIMKKQGPNSNIRLDDWRLDGQRSPCASILLGTY